MADEKESRPGCIDWTLLFAIGIFLILPTISWWWNVARAMVHWVKK